MTASAGATAPESNRPPRRARGFGSLLTAFLLGALLTAAAAVTLLMLDVLGGDDATPGAAPSASAEAPSDGTDGTTATGDVPPSCVEAAEYNQTFTEALDEIAVGVRDQDARRLQEALDAVQDAQPGSEAASQECRELAGQGGQDAPAADESEDDGISEPDASPDPDPSEASPEPSPGEPTATPTP